MKHKFFLAMTTLALTGTLLLAALAQDKLKLEPNKPHKVMLKCMPSGNMRDTSVVVVSNPTAQDIPQGTLVYTTTITDNLGSGPLNKQSPLPQVLKKNQGNEIAVAFVKGRIISCEAGVNLP